MVYERIRFGIGRQTHDLIGLCLTSAGLLILLAFFEGSGPVGRWTLGGLRFLIGVWVYAFPVILVALAAP